MVMVTVVNPEGGAGFAGTTAVAGELYALSVAPTFAVTAYT
jgi:hypothetical protein